MKTLIERQFENEELAVNIGINNYISSQRRVIERGDVTTLSPENYLLRKCLIPLADTIREHCMNHKMGPPAYLATRKTIVDAGPEAVAFIVMKTCLEIIRPTSLVVMAHRVAKNIRMHLDYMVFKKEMPGYVKAIEETMNSKSVSYKINVLRNHMGKKEIPIYPLKGGSAAATQLGSFLIYKLVEAVDVFELTMKGTGAKTQRYLQVSPLAAQWLENAHQQCAELSVQFLPMLVKPAHWESMYSGGFLSCAGQYKIPAVRSKHKEVIRALKEAESMMTVYNALNALQDTPYRINRDVLEVMQICREHALAGLPENDVKMTIPEKFWTTEEEFHELSITHPERIKQWKVDCAVQYDAWHRTKSKRSTLYWQLWTADRFKDEKEIFFCYNTDWRGRIYPLQPYLNCQADANGKALLEFANGKPLGDRGAYWLAIHGANTFGKDKISFADRVQWVKDNTALITDSAENPLDGQRFWMQADEPFMFLAFCHNWRGYAKEGDSFVSHLPINVDGSCSGLQHYSAMLRDEIGGYYVNLEPHEKPSDVYMKVSEEASKIVAKDTENPLAAIWNGRIDRGIAKRPTMTFAYSATVYGFSEQLCDELEKRRSKGEVFITDNTNYAKATMYMAKVSLDAINKVVVKAAEAMKWFREVADITAKAGHILKWVAPSGMVIHQTYYEPKTERVNTFHGSTRVRLNVSVDTDMPSVSKSKAGIAPNFIHSLDASHLVLTVNKCAENGITNFAFIHDSFGCSPGEMEKMNKTLRETFIEMYSGNILAEFKEQLREQLPPEVYESLPEVPKMGSLDLNKVRESLYFFA